MKNFFSWLFGLQKVDSAKITRNIQSEAVSDKKSQSSTYTMKNTNPVFFYIQRKFITKKEDDKSGLIILLELAEGKSFRPIHVIGKCSVVEKKRGISKVLQEVEMSYDNKNRVFEDLYQSKSMNEGISILYKNELGMFSLLGENYGMKVTELSEQTIKFSGEEDDTFYKLSPELAAKLTESL